MHQKIEAGEFATADSLLPEKKVAAVVVAATATANKTVKKGDDKEEKKDKKDKKEKPKKEDKPAFDSGLAKKEFVDPSCQYLKNPHAAPIVTEARAFFAGIGFGKKKFPVHAGARENWRGICKLSVRTSTSTKQVVEKKDNRKTSKEVKKTRVELGLYEPGSTKLLDLSHGVGSKVHHPRVDKAISAIAQALETARVRQYVQKDRDTLRYVIFGVEQSADGEDRPRIQVCFVWNSKLGMQQPGERNMLKTEDVEEYVQNKCPCLHRVLRVLRGKNFSDLLHSVWVHGNTQWQHSNSIVDYTGPWACMHSHANDKEGVARGEFGCAERMSAFFPKEKAVGTEGKDKEGDEKKSEEKKDKKDKKKEVQVAVVNPDEPVLYFPPNVFRQANIRAFAQIVLRIRNYMESKAAENEKKKLSVLELYGGVGTIGLNLDLKNSVEKLECSDSNPYNEACFRRSVGGLSEELQKKLVYTPLGASDMCADEGKLMGWDVLIVDPPRKGCDEDVRLALSDPKKCDAETLVYVSCGFKAFQRDYELLKEVYDLKVAEGHLLFPGSDHLETLAIFERRKEKVEKKK